MEDNKKQELDHDHKEGLDIFKLATESVLSESHKTTASRSIQEGELATGNKKMPPARARSWSELQCAFNTYHVERFNKVMQELPDREFVRVFVKIAPFFKKNAAQMQPTGPTTLNQINITVNRPAEKAEIKTIDVT